MNPRQLFAFASFVTVMLSSATCAQEGGLGDCRFIKAEAEVELGYRMAPLVVLRSDGDPDVLLFLDGENSEDGTKMSATRVELRTDRKNKEWLPAEQSPRGYTAFQGGEFSHDSISMITSGKLHFEYLGTSGTRQFPQWREGKWTLDKEKVFTGTRRTMYGTRPLLEQEFRKFELFGDVGDDVQIEADGDRIVCLCRQKGTLQRIGIFSKKKLDAEQRPLVRRQENSR